MKNSLQKLLGEALTRRHSLEHAGDAVQRALRAAAAKMPKNAPLLRGAGLVLDGLAQGLPGVGVPQPSPAPRRRAANDSSNSPRQSSEVGARFLHGTYSGPAGSRDYKLFVPGDPAGQARPLVVMLHGCKQDPDDFAAGTRMNELAEELGFLVLYPAQAPRSNVSKCWNWFMPGDQRRGHGEPALLAGMTQEVVAQWQVDPERVYIAGLSAGGAMAAIIGREYPDVFAAVGIHSGLPQGAAHDVVSAFSAMQNGAARDSAAVPAGRRSPAAPVIVFHGDRDGTVHPSNGADVISALLGDPAARADGSAIEASGSQARAAGRDFTRTVYRRRGAGAAEASLAEHWLVHGAGHAWSGGSPRGSFTDAQGPDASREMLRFFKEHARTA